MVHVALPAHGDANMHSTFMTTYDKEFPGHGTCGSLHSTQYSESGHTSNRVLFNRPPTLSSETTYQALFASAPRTISDAQWQTISAESLMPQVHCTPFVRIRSTVGVKRDERPTRSTMKDSYTNSGAISTCAPAMFSGDATSQFRKNFLHISSPDDSATASKQAAVKNNIGAKDGGTHACRKSLLHTSNLPGNYFQHSRLIGDRSLAHPNQLPVPLSGATDYESTISSCSSNAKSMLNTLAGRRSVSAPRSYDALETNPIPMSQYEQDRCQISRRVENQGNVRGTTYQAHFINQRNLPELADPSRDKRAASAIVLPNVPARPHQALVLTDSRGSLLEDRPAGIHPSVWTRLKTVEKALSVDKEGDPHAHKRRTQSIR